jgi:hypothetical protein
MKMRRQLVKWFEPSTEPLNDATVIFDYGAGAIVGIYRNGAFSSLKTPACCWPRFRVNRWRYCTPPDNFAHAAHFAAA